MNFQQTILIVSVGLILLLLLLNYIRKYQLHEKYSMIWFFVCIIFITLPIFTPVYNKIATWFGIIDPVSFYFFFAIIILLLFTLQFSLALSATWKQRKIMIIQHALLEERVRRLEDIINNNKKKCHKNLDLDNIKKV